VGWRPLCVYPLSRPPPAPSRPWWRKREARPRREPPAFDSAAGRAALIDRGAGSHLHSSPRLRPLGRRRLACAALRTLLSRGFPDDPARSGWPDVGLSARYSAQARRLRPNDLRRGPAAMAWAGAGPGVTRTCSACGRVASGTLAPSAGLRLAPRGIDWRRTTAWGLDGVAQARRLRPNCWLASGAPLIAKAPSRVRHAPGSLCPPCLCSEDDPVLASPSLRDGGCNCGGAFLAHLGVLVTWW
jgi:hypothetical protein